MGVKVQTIETINSSDKKFENKVSSDRFIYPTAGTSVIVRFLAPIADPNSQYEVLYKERGIYYGNSTSKPDALGKRTSFYLPELCFDTENSDNLDPMTYISNHPNDYLTYEVEDDKGNKTKRQHKISTQKTANVLVEATEPFTIVNKFSTTWDAKKYPLSTEVKVLKIKMSVYEDLYALQNQLMLDKNQTLEGKCVRITTSKSGNKNEYSITPIEAPSEVPVFEKERELEFTAPDTVGMANFKAQKSWLSKLGFDIPYDNPDGEEDGNSSSNEWDN